MDIENQTVKNLNKNMTILENAQSIKHHGEYSTRSAESDFLRAISEMIAEKPHVSQREMAKKTGVSLGMINSLLSRCAERGWIALQKLNKRKIAYVITPEGMTEVARRSVDFIRRNFNQLKSYSENIEKNIKKIAEQGKTRVTLCTYSEMRTFIEKACHANGLQFEFVNDKKFGKIDDTQLVVLGDEFDTSDGEMITVYQLVNGC